jgi:hypothetical protein
LKSSWRSLSLNAQNTRIFSVDERRHLKNDFTSQLAGRPCVLVAPAPLVEDVLAGFVHTGVRPLLGDAHDGLQYETIARGDCHRAGLGVALRKLMETLLGAGLMCSVHVKREQAELESTLFPQAGMRANISKLPSRTRS